MSDGRVTFTENETLVLYNEVDGVCPIGSCSEPLIFKKQKNRLKNFEIAHVYPLNPTPHQLKVLVNEERLSSDPNDLDNLLCLCSTCHTKYDKFTTVDEYRAMVALKKRLTATNQERAAWKGNDVESEIFSILEFLAADPTALSTIVEFEYEPKTIDEKADDTITQLTKRKIKQNVEDYFSAIKQKFQEIDSRKPLTTEVIASQVKTYYTKMRQQYTSQNEIFQAMVAWLHIKTNQTSREGTEIIVSYFVQNCEIF